MMNSFFFIISSSCHNEDRCIFTGLFAIKPHYKTAPVFRGKKFLQLTLTRHTCCMNTTSL